MWWKIDCQLETVGEWKTRSSQTRRRISQGQSYSWYSGVIFIITCIVFNRPSIGFPELGKVVRLTNNYPTLWQALDENWSKPFQMPAVKCSNDLNQYRENWISMEVCNFIFQIQTKKTFGLYHLEELVNKQFLKAEHSFSHKIFSDIFF